MYLARSILVPVDFSSTSKAAISVALQMADRSGAKILFVHTDATLGADMSKLLEESGSTGPIAAQIARHEAAIRQDVEQELARAEAAGQPLRRTDHAFHISGGHWVDVSLQLVEEHHIELIVSATHGGREGGLLGILQGSSTERLVRKAPCSVFVVRAEGFPYLTD